MSAPWADTTVAISGDRKLGYAGWGDPEGLPVFHFHGALTSRYEGFWLHPAAKTHGLRLMTLDRPGVGNSCHAPERRIADWPRDVAAFADSLGIDRFALVGVSGGGPYALACAHALPDRVQRVALIAGAGPLSRPEVFALMSGRQRAILGTLMARPRMLHAFLRGVRMLPQVLRMFAVTATLGGLSSADLATVRSREITERLKHLPPAAQLAPFGPDCEGPTLDGHLHGQPWGFEPREIRTPVDLWYAEDDRIVPASMGRYLAGVLPVNQAKYYPAPEGHLSLILGRADEFLGALRVSIAAPATAA